MSRVPPDHEYDETGHCIHCSHVDPSKANQPVELLTLVPEPWATRAAARIWEEQSKIMAELGHPSRGEPYRTKTVTTIARMIQYCHDAALPKNRN